MFKSRCSALWLAALSASIAPAENWWMAYEANGVYPEKVGWHRFTRGGGDQRYFQAGALVLDGRNDPNSQDFYQVFRPLHLEPGWFVMEWRLLVCEADFYGGPGICIALPDDGVLTLLYNFDSIYSLWEGVWIPFARGIFHDYRLTSHHMTDYTLYIDGQLAYLGQFSPTAWGPEVDWGDVVFGEGSLSIWDYVRLGVVPGPSLLPSPRACEAGGENSGGPDDLEESPCDNSDGSWLQSSNSWPAVPPATSGAEGQAPQRDEKE